MAYFQRLADAGQDCMWVLSPCGEVRYMNGRARRLLGATSDALVPETDIRDLWPAESRFSLDRAVAAAADGQPHRFRAFFGGGGEDRAYWETLISPVPDEIGGISDLIAISRDVTAAVETHAFLKTVIELLPAPLLVKNVQDRRFVLINRAAEDMLDLLPDEGLGRTIDDLLPSAANAVAEAERSVLAGGEVVRLDYHKAGDDGSGRDFTFKLLATHDDLGPRHLIAVGDDITERKAAAESLAVALRAAEDANRAKSAFIANMGHELRTPLNGIVAGADMLARSSVGDEGRKLAEMIRASGEALSRLLSDVLDIASAESGELDLRREPFALGETLETIAAPFRLAAESKGLAFEIAVDPSLPSTVAGDAAALRQVLTNLLGNAVKFTDRGVVRLEASSNGPDRVRLCVRDTGIGFDPAGKARLFDPFHQADQSYTRRFEGAGLGLAIARTLAERMGGVLDADGRPGEGAAFWLDIPLPACADEDDCGVAPGESPQAGLRVLLADDHPTNRQVVQLMLAGVADIHSVENGAEAVEVFETASFDLVLMDIQMPVMDGLTAIREIRRREAIRHAGRTPILVLSANALPEHRAGSAQAGADGHLGKPLTVEQLFAAITEVIEAVGDAHSDQAEASAGA